jgi:primary-amine oxidase
MPVTTVGFLLKPTGFFDGNPALDLRPTHATRCAPNHAHPDPAPGQ